MVDEKVKLEEQIREAVDAARTLRDEIRVRVHLATLEAKDQWRELEPKVEMAERFAREVSETSRKAAEEVVARYREFKRSLDVLTPRGDR
jgi:hypothetical protein